jgi:hypothetical protein
VGFFKYFLSGSDTACYCSCRKQNLITQKNNTMKNTKKTILTGSLIAGSIFGTTALNASETNLFHYTELGSGSEIRANLLNQTESDFRAYLLELNCGEDTKKVADTTKTENKTKDAKCGEAKDAKAKDAKAVDVNAAEVKGTNKKPDATKEGKSKDAKCGEGKCGVE